MRSPFEAIDSPVSRNRHVTRPQNPQSPSFDTAWNLVCGLGHAATPRTALDEVASLSVATPTAAAVLIRDLAYKTAVRASRALAGFDDAVQDNIEKAGRIALARATAGFEEAVRLCLTEAEIRLGIVGQEIERSLLSAIAGLAAARRSWDARAGRSHAHTRAGRVRPLAKRRRAKGRGNGRGGRGLRRAAVRLCPRGSPSPMPDGIPSFRHCSLAICTVPRCLQTRLVRCERQLGNGSLFFYFGGLIIGAFCWALGQICNI